MGPSPSIFTVAWKAALTSSPLLTADAGAKRAAIARRCTTPHRPEQAYAAASLATHTWSRSSSEAACPAGPRRLAPIVGLGADRTGERDASRSRHRKRRFHGAPSRSLYGAPVELGVKFIAAA